MTESRKLAAIFAADVVGFSRLTGNDEERTLARLRALRSDLIDPVISIHKGRVVKRTGDGFLVEFRSVVDAVRCAVEVQNEMVERNAGVPAERRIDFRIGIHLGDVVEESDGDLMGDGVNIAARLEGVAEPGAICLSEDAYRQVKSRLDVPIIDLGEKWLKNIAEPVRVYSLQIGVANQGKPPAQSPSAPLRKPSISPAPPNASWVYPASIATKPAVAVLPFGNMSGDPEQEYFSDGLTEDIITLLSAWRSFPVIARNSSFAFKKQSRDIRLIARELSARYVLEGSVRKGGDRIRVTAQLIDAEAGHHLWAKKFDGSHDDIFALQDEITLQIVSSVEPELEKAELKKMETSRPSSRGAWDFYLRGREHLHGFTPADNLQARGMFERAIELDPPYSDAFAGLSQTYLREILFETTDDRAAAQSKALELARRAVTLDNESSLAHQALSGAFIWSNQHANSITEARIAVQLNPSNIAAWLALANRLDIVGESAEGIPLLEKTLRRNPRDPLNHIYYGQLARAYINARDYDKALGLLREAVRLQPDYPNTYHILAICLGHLGQIEEARAAAQHCEQLRPGFLAKRAHWNIYVDPNANAHLTEGLRKAGLVE